MSGLASLATYTDSEGEDDSLNRSGSAEKSVAVLLPQPPRTSQKPKQKNSARRVARLVSYHDDIIISDDEGGGVTNNLQDKEDGEISLEDETEEAEDGTGHEEQKISDTAEAAQSDEDDIQLPPEPSGRCNAELQDKISRLYKRMQTSKVWDMNQIIQDKKDFRNPSIYEKLIQFCSINELGTNYPPAMYDPERWGKGSFYDELAKAQKIEMEKREKEKKERTKVEFVSGTAKRVNTSKDDSTNRKSKWDQVGGLAPGLQVPGLLRPVGIMSQSSLTNPTTGAKATIISAFGSLPKRPKI